MQSKEDQRFKFDDFEVDANRRLLLKQGSVVNLNPKAFDLLLVLIENHGKLLSKNELLDTVWAGQFVEENNLTVHIAGLRKALGENKNEHRFIVTVPGKGYKFVGEPNRQDDVEIVVETHQFERIVIEEEITDEAPEKLSLPPEKRRKYLAVNPFYIFGFGGIILVAIVTGWSVWRTGEKKELRPFRFTKLTSSGKITNATVTPDAKYAVFSQVEKDGESLWLRQIAIGSQSQILKPQAVNFVGLAVTPDSSFIYATVFSNDWPDPQVWRIPLLGGAAEHIKGIATGTAVSFSPDGKRMAFTESHSSIKETHLEHTDLDGTDNRPLLRAKDDERSLPNFRANPVAWSPDGTEVAVAVEENIAEGGRKAFVLLINVNDKSEKRLTENLWNYVENISWLDAENLAFIGDGKLWTVSRQTGETRRIGDDLNDYSWIAGASGTLLTVKKDVVSKVSIADFDERADRFESRPIIEESGDISTVNWTLDGKIVYRSTASGRPEVWRAGPDGSERTQLTVNSKISFGLSISPVDGSMLFAAGENGKHTLVLTDAEGKNLRRLIDGTENVWGSFTPDGRSVVFQRGLNNKKIYLWRFDLADQKLTQLSSAHAVHPAVSPDGTQIAHYFMDNEVDNLWRIKLISSSTGEFAGKIDLPKEATERRMRWHPGGQFLSQVTYRGEDASLSLLPIRGGGESRSFYLGKGELQWFEWSKDGKRIVFSQSTETQDVVLLNR